MTIENCWTYLLTNYCSYLFFDFWYCQIDKSWFICYCKRHHSILFFPIWSDLPGRHKQYTLFTVAQTAPSAPEKYYKTYKSPATMVVSTPPKNNHAVISAFSLESVLNSKCKVTPRWNLARKLNINLTVSTKNKEAYYTVCSWHTLVIQTVTGRMLRHSQGNSRLHSTISELKAPFKRSLLHFSRVPLLLNFLFNHRTCLFSLSSILIIIKVTNYEKLTYHTLSNRSCIAPDKK